MSYDNFQLLLPEPLLVFAWQHGIYDPVDFNTRNGESVTVLYPGRRNVGQGPDFLDAEVRIGDKTYVGNVAVHEKSSDWGYFKRNYDSLYDGVILNVVAEDDRIVRKVDDSVLQSARLSVPGHLLRTYDILQKSAGKYDCGYHMTRSMNEIEFKAAYTRLMVDRLERKVNDILQIYDSVEKSWHETFHVLLFRSMGLGENKQIYMTLARHVPYAKLCKERGDLENIEAMLFGVAGLLDTSLYDEYKSNLFKRFEQLRDRHGLQALAYCEWSDKGVRPYNFVPKRIAQLAALINNNDFTFNNVLSAESFDEVRSFFRIEMSDYWKRSFSFSSRTERKQKAIGEETIDILIINLVAPILFAYGRLEGREELKERAIEFLYQTKAEKNRYTEGWRTHGVKIEHALASQALIQLSTEYCLSHRCAECFVGSRILKNSF